MAVARQVAVDLTYGGNSIWADVEAEALKVVFVEEASGKVDRLSVELADPTGKWSGEWFPPRGAVIEAAITSIGFPPEDIELDCGTFEITEVKGSGPPDKVGFEAQSVKVTKKLKKEKRTYAWQNISLKNLCVILSGSSGLELDYQGEEIRIEREDQNDITDLQFLTRLCAKYDHGLKIFRDTLRVYSFEGFEGQPPALTIDRAGGRVLKWNFKADAHDIFRGCEVQYHDPVRDQTVVSTYTPKYPPVSGSVHRIKAKVKTAAEARALAYKAIRQANGKELTGSITVAGDLRLRAANNTQLQGFGIADTYPVVNTKVVHSVVGGGFTSALDFRRVVILDQPRVNNDLDVL